MIGDTLDIILLSDINYITTLDIICVDAPHQKKKNTENKGL